MKRRTNLFYNTGPDAEFITFSNYTESLTGAYLATDVKLFPSAFLCMKINLGDVAAREAKSDEERAFILEEQKKKFIKHLAANYENKLAYVRQMLVDAEENPEDYLYPLDWLITSIYKFDNSAKITYVSQITEQDYNGTFTDIIMMVDPNNTRHVTLMHNTNPDSGDLIEYESDKSYLYGWFIPGVKDGTQTSSYAVQPRYVGPEEYRSVTPILDTENNQYNCSKTVTKYEVAKSDEALQFNIIIPLYDVVHMKKAYPEMVINASEDFGLNDANATNKVPLGIWFANKTITLDNTGRYKPTWSLSLGTQFKPFPYSDKYDINEIDQDAKNDAFITYAQIVSKHNEIIKTMSKMHDQFVKTSNEIIAIKSQIQNIASENVVDGIQKTLASITKDNASIKADIEGLKERMNEYLNWNIKDKVDDNSKSIDGILKTIKDIQFDIEHIKQNIKLKP